MTAHEIIFVGLVVCCPLIAESRGWTLSRIGGRQLAVTLGALERSPSGRLVTVGPKTRAVIAARGPEAALRFRYLGPTRQTALLGSGRLRRQLGLMLGLRDTCNLVYVMWRLDPVPGLVVSVKHNPGKRLHTQCKNAGYRNIEPLQSRELPLLERGRSHLLRAWMRGGELRVLVDRELVWRGRLGETAPLGGKVGLRTDNVRVELDFFARAKAVRGTRAGKGGERGSRAPSRYRSRR